VLNEFAISVTDCCFVEFHAALKTLIDHSCDFMVVLVDKEFGDALSGLAFDVIVENLNV